MSQVRDNPYWSARDKRVVCVCGKGYGSPYDGLCVFCREKLLSRAQCRAIDHKHSRGDGVTVSQYRVAIGEQKRSELWI